MNIKDAFLKFQGKCAFYIIQTPRIYYYSLLSNRRIKAIKTQPVLADGEGQIDIGCNVRFGVKSFRGYYNGYSYLHAKRKHSHIVIGDNTWISNNLTIISDGKKIVIGKNCLIGSDVEIVDSNFHDVNPENRLNGAFVMQGDVRIDDNVFIGNNVTILKGVHIGKNSAIANRAVVTKSIPANTISAGIPAKVVKELSRPC